MDILIESMTRFVHRHKTAPWRIFKTRVWRQEVEWSPKSSEICTADCLAAIAELDANATQYDIAVKILEVERVNAVEVLDNDDNGPVIYKDWP